MLENMSIEQLAELVNQKINNTHSITSSDKRVSNKLTPRRIRDYIDQGLLEKPFKNGKFIYFTQMHVNKLIALRTMQVDGLSDKYMKKITDSHDKIETIENNDVAQQKAALALIDNIKNMSGSASNSYSLLGNSPTQQLQYLSQPKSKTWIEFPLDIESKCFLKLEVGADLKNKEQILKNIKEILNIKG